MPIINKIHVEMALYCIVSIHLYSASYSAHQSEALSVRETQRAKMPSMNIQKRCYIRSA